MLFESLKYLQPTNYFSIPRNDGTYIFPKVEIRDNNEAYKSLMAKTYDASWQWVNKGGISDGVSYRMSEINSVCPYDEYVFIRRYFNGFWAVYVLVLKMLTFQKPIKQVKGFVKSRHVTRKNLKPSQDAVDNIALFDSVLVKEQPLVSVVIPTLNRYDYLGDVLLDLEAQTHTNFEVIIVDQSEPYQPDFYEKYRLNIHLIRQKEPGLWKARNHAIKESNADYLLLFDDDSRIDPDWIRHHLICLEYFNSSLSSGVSLSKVGAPVPSNYSYFKLSDQLDTGNVMIKKSVFESVGLFDLQFEGQRMGDGEFGMRCYKAGFLNISNPLAKRLHLKVNSGGLRQMGSWDAYRPARWWSPRPIPSVLYFFRSYFGNRLTLFQMLKAIPLSLTPYRYKGRPLAMAIGIGISIVLWPIIVIQFLRSWYSANKMIDHGSIIEPLT